MGSAENPMKSYMKNAKLSLGEDNKLVVVLEDGPASDFFSRHAFSVPVSSDSPYFRALRRREIRLFLPCCHPPVFPLVPPYRRSLFLILLRPVLPQAVPDDVKAVVSRWPSIVGSAENPMKSYMKNAKLSLGEDNYSSSSSISISIRTSLDRST